MSNQQLATQGRDIRAIIQSDKVREQIALALPTFLTPTRMLRVCLTSVNRNPRLLECTAESLLSSIMTAAQMGIEPDGRNGHLIPRWNRKKSCYEATFQPDYKGLVSLVRKNENVADIYAERVYDKDEIKVTKGLKRDLQHEVDIKADRGSLIGVYAVIIYKDGYSAFEYMSRADVESVRARSDSWKAHLEKGYDSPWKTDEGEMFKKTAIKRLLKLADLSPEIAERVDAASRLDDRSDAGEIEIKPASIPESKDDAGREPQQRLTKPATAELVDENNPGEPESEHPPAQDSEKPKRGRPRKKQPAEPDDIAAPAQDSKGEPPPSEAPQKSAPKLTEAGRVVLAKLEKEGLTWDDLVAAAEKERLMPLDDDALELIADENADEGEESNWQAMLNSIRSLKGER